MIPFPFAELTNKKVCPAIVICETKDVYQDIVVCAVSSVIPVDLMENEMLLKKDGANNLRVNLVAKIDRIVTAKRSDVIAKLGKLTETDLESFKEKFKSLIDS